MYFKTAPLVFALLVFVFLFAGCGGLASEKASEAISKNDPTLCNSLEDTSDQTQCLLEYSNEKHSPNACLVGKNPEDCVSQYAGEHRAVSVCDILTDPIKRYTCVAKVTGDSTGRSVELMIADWNTKGAATKCIDRCKSDGYDCRKGCDSTNTQESEKCKDHGYASEDWRICVVEAQRKSDQCKDDCNYRQWNECEPPCKDI